eukprot:9356561-Pyramimonas_sp.AAC.1
MGSDETRPPGATKGGDSASAAEQGLLGDDEIHITSEMSKMTKFLKFFGPGLLIATVYVDPGQIVVDMESGSTFQYRMLWVLFAA